MKLLRNKKQLIVHKINIKSSYEKGSEFRPKKAIIHFDDDNDDEESDLNELFDEDGIELEVFVIFTFQYLIFG